VAGYQPTCRRRVLSGLAHPVVAEPFGFCCCHWLIAAGSHGELLIPAAFLPAAMAGTGVSC